MKNILRLLILATLFSCSPKIEKTDSSNIQLDEIISRVDSIAPFNGVVGILKKGDNPQIVYHGFKSPLAKSEILDSSDYFHLASNSKLFTGFSILKVMDEFGLDYNDSIAPFFPELHPKLQKVTIQQLANHTCAIHDFFSLIENPEEITNEQALRLISQLDSTVYEPGTQWGYTNSGYVLLSLLVERVTKQDYNDYLRKEILSPLDMESVQLHPDKINALKGFNNDHPSKTLSVTTGSAGMYVTPNHLIHFFNTQEKMSSYIKQAKTWSSPWKDQNWRYGFGWFFSEDERGEFRAHSGKSGGFESYIRIYEPNDLMIFILTNHVNGSAKLLREEIIKEINK